MSERTNIDKTIREKFEDFSVEPPVHLWGEISGELAAGKRRKRIAAFGWIAAAAVVVIAFLAGWLINDHSKQVLPSMVEQPKVQENNQNQTESQPQNQKSVSQNQEQPVIAKSNVQTGRSESETHKAARTFVVKNVDVNTETESEVITTSKREEWNVEYLATKTAEFDQENQPLLVTQIQGKQEEKRGISAHDEVLIVGNIQKLKQENKPEHGWIVGAHLSPGYAAHTSSYSASYSGNMSTNSEGGVRNVGGGVSVQYKTGKKLRIESGVYYAQNSQSAGSSNGLFNMSPSYDFLSGNAEYSGNDPVYANTVELKREGMIMNSTAGVVNLNQTPQGAELSAKTDGSDLNTATLITNGEFTQQFDFIEIPMYLRYRVVDGKFGIDLMGGLNAGLVVGNNVFIQSDYGKQNVGTTESISTLNLSGTVGMGVSYSMGTHFSLSLEPRMSYYLNSINTNPDVSYKPYRLGLFTGIYYQF